MDLTNIFVIGAALVAIVYALLEVLKRTFNIKKRFLPITATVVGILFGFIIWPLTDYDIYTMLISGLVAGLTAGGTFDIVKATFKGDKR